MADGALDLAPTNGDQSAVTQLSQFTFHSSSELETDRLGRALASALVPGTVVALIGDLGAAKTRLVQAVATALGVAEGEPTSPTFVLINEYQGELPIYHFDAYRLRDDDEFLELGPEEYFESAGLCFVEWADRVANCLPPERLEIRCTALGAAERSFSFTANDDELAAIVQQVKDAVEAGE